MTDADRSKLLFLVRHVNKTEAQTLQSAGFKFAPVPSVIDSLAQSLQISTTELSPYLDDMRNYSTKPQTMEPGVHLAFFALRPAISSGFDILVRKNTRNLLPSTPLGIDKLERWQIDLLAGYNEWESEKLLEHWKMPATRNVLSDEEQYFLAQMAESMRRLSAGPGSELFRRSRLVAKPLIGPCQNKQDGKTHAAVIVFRVITDIHWHQAAGSSDESDEFLSSRLFMTYQHVYHLSNDHTAFAGRVHQEFAPVLAAWPGPSSRSGSHTGLKRFSLTRSPFSFRRLSSKRSADTRDNSEDNVLEKRAVRSPSTVSKFGGVHVSEEVRIEIEDANSSERSTSRGMSMLGPLGEYEMSDMGMRTEISAVRDENSMIDELMQLTLGKYTS